MFYDDITLITTVTPGRKFDQTLCRSIQYHSQFMRILVCGLAECNLDILVKDYSRATALLSDSDDICDKLRICLDSVKTPYVIWVADDDFTGEDYIKKSITVLNQYDQAVGTDGIGLFFNEGSAKLTTNITYNIDSIEFFISSYKKSLSPLKKFSERMLLQARRFSAASVHGIMRTKIMKKVFHLPLMLRTDIPVRWRDNITVFLVLLHGGVLPIRKIAYIRSEGTRRLDLCHAPEIEKKFLVKDEELFNNFRGLLEMHGLNAPEDHAAAMTYFMQSSGAIFLGGFQIQQFSTEQASGYFQHHLSNNENDNNNVNAILNLVKNYRLIAHEAQE